MRVWCGVMWFVGVWVYIPLIDRYIYIHTLQTALDRYIIHIVGSIGTGHATTAQIHPEYIYVRVLTDAVVDLAVPGHVHGQHHQLGAALSDLILIVCTCLMSRRGRTVCTFHATHIRTLTLNTYTHTSPQPTHLLHHRLRPVPEPAQFPLAHLPNPVPLPHAPRPRCIACVVGGIVDRLIGCVIKPYMR